MRQFAGLAGITVKTLHHYDRLGLLRPRRASSGYRLYSQADLVRIEQILALKTIGFSLTDIRSLLDRDALPLPAIFVSSATCWRRNGGSSIAPSAR